MLQKSNTSQPSPDSEASLSIHIREILNGTRPFEITSWGRRTLESTWGARRRTVDAEVVYFIIEGHLHLGVEGSQRVIRKGELMWLPRLLKHDLLKGAEKTTVIHLRVTWTSKDTNTLFAAPQIHFLPQVVTPLMTLGDKSLKLFQTESKQIALATILIEIAHQAEQPTHAQHQGVQKALAWAGTAPLSTWSLQKFSAIAGMTQDRFSRAFTKQTGNNFRAWLLSERLQLAKAILSESEEAIKLVAGKCGWDNPLLFSRLFRQSVGMSPKAWRARDKSP